MRNVETDEDFFTSMELKRAHIDVVLGTVRARSDGLLTAQADQRGRSSGCCHLVKKAEQREHEVQLQPMLTQYTIGSPFHLSLFFRVFKETG